MSPEQKLAVTVAQQRMDRAIAKSAECDDELTRTCARKMSLVGKLFMQVAADEGLGIDADIEAVSCPNMSSTRCPLYQEVQVELPDNVTHLDTRRAS